MNAKDDNGKKENEIMDDFFQDAFNHVMDLSVHNPQLNDFLIILFPVVL